MGEYIREGDDLIYRQADGERTARLIGYSEKKALTHEGSPKYQKIFYILVAAGVIYLSCVFALL